MTRNTHIASSALLGLGATAFGMSMPGGGFTIDWWTIDGGCGNASGGDFELRGTIGQHDAGFTMSAGTFEVNGGFWGGGMPDEGNGSVTLFDLQILTGALLGGGLPELETSDDQYVHTRSGFGETIVDLHSMEALVSGVTTLDNGTLLNVLIEDRIEDAAGLAQIRLRDWNSNEFEMVGSYPLGNTDQIHELNGLDATRYVSNLGEIDCSIKHLVFVPFLAYTFQSYVDQVVMEVE